MIIEALIRVHAYCINAFQGPIKIDKTFYRFFDTTWKVMP
jgi:hypothetical protein